MNTLLAPSPPRSPWQLAYGGLHRLRRQWYLRHGQRLPRPVISIGNLHWGGSGKTPLTANVAAHLRDRGLVVAVLSRGYGRRSRGVQVVSTGEGPLLGPLVAGDEPVLLAGELPGVAVVVGAERYQAGRHALERLEPPPEVFVLDDGFSHLQLWRDLDLLAFPVTDPFAGGRLLPGGRLREPLASAARAHAVLLTGVVPAGGAGPTGAALAESLRGFGFTGPGFTSELAVFAPRFDPGRPLAPGARVVLVCAIARPRQFRDSALAAGCRVVAELAFPDHHPYPEASLQRIRDVWRDSAADAVLTTTKDRVKLHGRLDLPLAELPVAARPEPAFRTWLDAWLDARGLSSRK